MDVSDRTAIAAQLRAMANLVEVAEIDDVKEFPLTFEEVRAQRPVAWLKQIKAWGIADYRYLYQFSIEAHHAKRLRNAFFDAKGAKVGNRAYCRLNEWPEGDTDGTALYVGSTRELGTRLTGHLGYGYGRTYAMHLSHWLPELEGGLRLQIWRYNRDSASATMQAIEDGLWAIRKPLLGRQGAR